ncbi:cysteine--tRNA ligase [candidate division WWE3 bacterium CG_4_9_14_0_2_um_filter_35_11]|uniref:Cysteine--tRNA ligase n=1 Tax=candidate division WWE3 bacterium CG_4_9_14_0_2_um_filter_35_11 TaxID=1975077 RepID=A0A2M8EM70_UNCKA|nr:MAG: cysteine--tRNA ligase [candidate division WWE3 bacterium CG10_big_fil_rev_8_21_14_0_10_35_32]PJC23833.1 MAG: cysteine--tRNA ligase [candidate division WWE3 bacterium CG_4_9_14_0_2_um_filter_35_11]
MKFYNSLSRKKEEFIPMNSPHVGMYTCGPTIYSFPTIGNWRTYTLSDLAVRTFKYFDYDVKHVMNLTDVGHLSGDNLGDSSTGEDRMAKAAEKEGVDAWSIAGKYGKDFLDSMSLLNIEMPDVIAKATDHVKEQIDLIKKIEEKGYAYKTDDGIYFDVAKYESDGNTYGELSTLDKIKEGARVEINPQKKGPRDFALWKFFAKGQKRHNMQWESPWGTGFPGWHIECSAMSMKYLGDQFDVHLGGEDLRSTHHPNEIAQSECATGHKPFVKYWIHGAFLLVDGGRMGKSLGNAYTIHDVINKGYDTLALRYFYLSGHYRRQINFTWEALDSAQNGLNRLRREVSKLGFSENAQAKMIDNEYKKSFEKALSDDLNMPESLAILWKLLGDETISLSDKASLVISFDQVLGLKLVQEDVENPDDIISTGQLSKEVQQLVKDREEYRNKKEWEKADEVRNQIGELGYEIEDTPNGVKFNIRY